MASAQGFRLPWLVRGDIDGFFGLIVDNLVQLLVVSGLLTGIYGMPAEIVYGVIFPGAAVSLLFGNAFYTFQARRLARREGREDVCALPYGINTPSMYAFTFFIIAPVWAANCDRLGDADAARLAWHVCLAAGFLSGVLELSGAAIGAWVRRVTPRPALLATLAGIAISLISMPFVIHMFSRPLLCFLPLAIILACYFGRLRLPFGLPGGFAAVAAGAALAWLGGLMDPEAVRSSLAGIGLHPPRLMAGEVLGDLDLRVLVNSLPIIVPMGLINAMGTLQNIESAEAAGDSYPVASTMSVNGLGSIVGALFGNCFPTTVYIGHPGWKALGARSGYSLLNGAVITLLCLSGALGVLVSLVPPEAAYPILLYIGLVICSQAFSAADKRHFPAVCVGLVPGIAAWGLMLVGFSLTAATGGRFDLSIAETFRSMLDFDLQGLMNLAGGFLFSAMFLTAITVYFIENDFYRVILWSLAAAAFAFFGLIHSGTIVAGQFTDRVAVGAAWRFSLGYLMIAAMAGVFMLQRTRGNNRNEEKGRSNA
ncbi:MAG: NCS2 family permease [Candidatus Glassbacteria bacterium]|nr:NCS2 family permease [Candidatus Glassbacteria bacterium]